MNKMKQTSNIYWNNQSIKDKESELCLLMLSKKYWINLIMEKNAGSWILVKLYRLTWLIQCNIRYRITNKLIYYNNNKKTKGDKVEFRFYILSV